MVQWLRLCDSMQGLWVPSVVGKVRSYMPCGQKQIDKLIDTPINPIGNQPYIFIERTDAETEAPILWPPDVKSWLSGKDPDAGKD